MIEKGTFGRKAALKSRKGQKQELYWTKRKLDQRKVQKEKLIEETVATLSNSTTYLG